MLIHRHIQERAELVPDIIAIDCEATGQISYRELERQASSAAAQLICGRGSIVPINMSRTSHLVVAMLAVLKTGAAYTLLSPDAPADRNRAIVQDTKARFVLVDKTTAGFMHGDCDETEFEALSQHAGNNTALDEFPAIYQASSDIAYVIYTSGTSGKPKGVLVSHFAASTGLLSMPLYKPAESSRSLLLHSPSFSAAQRTILGTLVRGGTLCVASKSSITVDLSTTISRLSLQSLEITPSLLNILKPEELPKCVKRITLGGEKISDATVDTWVGRAELVSAYGLSECTQLSMRSSLSKGKPGSLLGWPSDSTVPYILRPGSYEAVPTTVPGELCLGGDQLADGYLNLPNKTQQAFVANPFGQGRLYRTGDMVVLRPDGYMELLGRIDQQTKVEGHRVEPEESNSHIQRKEEVASSAVVPATIQGQQVLVAAIVPRHDTTWPKLVKELRAILRSKLSSYAIPQYWLQLQAMPLNANGKADLAALRTLAESTSINELVALAAIAPAAPSFSKPNDHDPAPGSASLLEIISGVLQLRPEHVDLVSSFQDLGGSSLKAIVLATRLREASLDISAADILQLDNLKQVLEWQKRVHSQPTHEYVPFSLLPHGFSRDPVTWEDAYPATPLQTGILADTMMGANYWYQRVYQLNGITITQATQALNTIIAQHSIFRTGFVPWKRGFIQVVKRRQPLNVTNFHDISLEEARQSLANDTMPLSGPLVKAAFLNESLLILVMHHALFDYWSSQFLVQDATSILKRQKPIVRAPFSKFVASVKPQDPESEAFWREYLQTGPDTKLLLNTTNSEPQKLQADIGDLLVDFCKFTGTTLGAAVHEAWALTLMKLIGSDDVTFLTAISGRDAPLEGIMTLNGPTLSVVPLRVRRDPNAPVATQAKQTQDNLWHLSKYGQYGLRRILSAAGKSPSAFNTMVNVLITLQDFAPDSPLAPVIIHEDNFTQYVTLEIDESLPSSVKLLAPAGLDHAHARQILDSFLEVLQSMEQDYSDTKEAVTPAGSDCDEYILLSNGSTIPEHEPEFGLAHDAFEKVAVTSPANVAVRHSNGQEWTYSEINAESNKFCRWLLDQGVETGEMIPLYMEKSKDVLVALLGILKAGAAFTPMDPANPHERNAFIVKDVAARRMISDSTHQQACHAFGCDVIVLSDLYLGHYSHDNIAIQELTPSNTAYAIYTSGSTGLPKGVLVPHSAVVAATIGMVKATNVNADWVALWVLNYVFDASYYDVFTILSTGGTLCIAPQDDILSDLTGHINRMNVKQVMLTPTITKMIRNGPADVPGLEVLNVCGEKIDMNILSWAERIDVYNGYGPTEATILMTVSKVQPDGDLNSIGIPLQYVKALVARPDAASIEPVADGEVGELCVAGPQLANGYLNRAEQTRLSFVELANGERWYRTGDLASKARDGSLICYGRKDYQVKLNGFRIELGEIENAIERTGEVDAVVVTVAELSQKRQLVAFCIFKGDRVAGPPTLLSADGRLNAIKSLVQSLDAGTLSHYMIPALFLPYTAFPTLPSGKADRKRLTAYAECLDKTQIVSYSPQSVPKSEFKTASTATEVALQQAWAAVLDCPESSVGANSDFLALGGDSIAAINVASECRRMGYGVSVAKLLANPLLADQARQLSPLAASIAKGSPTGFEIPESLNHAIEEAGLKYRDDVEDVYPCGPGQSEFLSRSSEPEQYWNLVVCRDLPSDFDLERWLRITQSLTARNQILRATYFPVSSSHGTNWYQVVLKSSTLDWSAATYGSDDEKAVLINDLRRSEFTFGKAMIAYKLLVHSSTGRLSLCIKVSHGSYDGTLLRIFDEQFTALARDDSVIPQVNSFKQYIEWVSQQDRNTSLGYWKQLLQDYTPPPTWTDRLATDSKGLAAITADVDAIALRFGVTASTVFQAVNALVVGNVTSSSDVLVDNLITGRNADITDPQTVNGTCANFLPFRSKLSASTTVANFLKTTQSDFWDTTEHGSVNLDDIYQGVFDWDRKSKGGMAKMLYCYQPFDPAPAGSAVNHMRWIVMAQSQVFMTFNYALYVEVQKTAAGGHRLKLEWDSRALGADVVERVGGLFNRMLAELASSEGDARLPV
ncbi:hypothetical protein CERZMDRAFT_32461 [Cercospora zeae-maydis SCOH1-5]|uniref:Carrier domain-containing protein n=1 Tax=Cercospora zeae-maydis SCOH1-5 TaxID=717836 RepID=A0A6A6FU31_9PEZI|nr:hypothetical protein CERZMDRAFT_32461 [Cercospora zeae-maydis SCOH1-5]